MIKDKLLENSHEPFIDVIGFDRPRPKWWVRLCIGSMRLTGPECNDYFKAVSGAKKLAAMIKVEVKISGYKK